MSSFVDTMVTATTGQKAGLASSPDSQIKTILESVAIALRDIAENVEEEKKHGHRQTMLQRFSHWIKYQVGTTDAKNPAWDEKIMGDDEENEMAVPIVVIDNFMYHENPKNAVLWEDLAEWAALLVENELAHVVIVSANVGLSKVLSKGKEGLEKDRGAKVINSFAWQECLHDDVIGCTARDGDVLYIERTW